MGLVGMTLGVLLLTQNTTLALFMKEGDDKYRGHPWLRAFEPQSGPLATDAGRIAAFRAWVLVTAAGFLAVGAGLALRGAITLF